MLLRFPASIVRDAGHVEGAQEMGNQRFVHAAHARDA